MKRKIIIIAVIIISLSTALTITMITIVFLSGNMHAYYSIGKQTVSITEYSHEKLKSSGSYDIKAEIALSNNIVSIKEDIAVNNTGKRINIYLPSANTAETKIKNVISDNGEIEVTRHEAMLEIVCNSIPDKICIEYEIELKQNNNILSYSGSSTYLGNFLATPAVYDGGKPILGYKSVYGDPYIYETYSYYAVFRIDSNMEVYAPGKKEEHSFGSNKIVIFEAQDIRDFSAVIMKEADVRVIRNGDTNIYFINSYEASAGVKTAFDYAQKMIGPYPYKELFVVKMPLYHEGMEFSNMIFLSDSCFSSPNLLKRVAYHEVFHQWFYGIIGTDQLNEPFLDEGLTSYLSGMLSGSTFNGSGSRKFLHMRLSDYTSRQEYYRIAYYDSAFYFNSLHKKMGNDFFKALQIAYRQYKFKIIYFSDFEKIVSELK